LARGLATCGRRSLNLAIALGSFLDRPSPHPPSGAGDHRQFWRCYPGRLKERSRPAVPSWWSQCRASEQPEQGLILSLPSGCLLLTSTIPMFREADSPKKDLERSPEVVRLEERW